jgi:hypothetical protein
MEEIEWDVEPSTPLPKSYEKKNGKNWKLSIENKKKMKWWTPKRENKKKDDYGF